MLQKIFNSVKVGKTHGGFGITILFPGNALATSPDTGLGTIGRIDQATVQPGTLIPMHPHRDDEILTYLRQGAVKHLDSEGHTDRISPQRLMLMNAGASFNHEERVLPEGDVLRGLQIFLRPQESGLPPMVQFYDLPDTFSRNGWRAIAGPDATAPLRVRSQSWVHDMRLEAGQQQGLPTGSIGRPTYLLYVFAGEVSVNEAISLTTGESLLVEAEPVRIVARQTSDLVLFTTDRGATYSEDGMYSGNKKKNVS